MYEQVEAASMWHRYDSIFATKFIILNTKFIIFTTEFTFQQVYLGWLKSR